MTFRQACDIIYPAVTKFMYVKSGIHVETVLSSNEEGKTFWAIHVEIGGETRTQRNDADPIDFFDIAEWIESKCQDTYLRINCRTGERNM